ncbi:MAG: sulfatase-like hydrolase/transferase, partial [Armatimonadota bacterium]|nr:sulfatase-like hydrolase/transferase [Armatimonadota bacterium]
MNIVVICMDTLRADITEHAWEDDVAIPHLDRLRETSVVFEQCYGEAEPTIPMRKGCFTGMRGFPWRIHIDDTGSFPNIPGWHAIPPEQTTLAEAAVAAGVCTGLVTDVWHYFKPTMNYVRGFAGYAYIRGQEGDTTRTGPVAAVLPQLARHLPADLATPEKTPGMVKYLLNVLDRKGEEDYFAAQVFRTASQWLRDNAANQPFLLWVDSFTPHECWDPPVYYADRYFSKPGLRDYIYPQFVQRTHPFTE